jgi:hypothetical protein
MIKYSMGLLALVLLTGCVAKKAPTPVAEPVTPGVAPQPAPVIVADSSSRTLQCRRELEALQGYNPAKYRQYNAEFERTAGNLKKYLEIKNGIGSEVNDLAMPKYQFAIRDICFRIKNELATSIIHKA